MWFQGLTIHGIEVVVLFAVISFGYIILCLYPWLFNKRNKP